MPSASTTLASMAVLLDHAAAGGEIADGEKSPWM